MGLPEDAVVAAADKGAKEVTAAVDAVATPPGSHIPRTI
jgi:hypothetical protein